MISFLSGSFPSSNFYFPTLLSSAEQVKIEKIEKNNTDFIQAMNAMSVYLFMININIFVFENCLL